MALGVPILKHFYKGLELIIAILYTDKVSHCFVNSGDCGGSVAVHTLF